MIVTTMTVTTPSLEASNEMGIEIETTTAISIGATDVVAQETGRDVSYGIRSRAYQEVDNIYILCQTAGIMTTNTA
jgi:hypothetical protein